MSPDAQRIAIAEACGWEPTPEGHFHPDNPTGQISPDYLNDLNAMHEAWLNVILPKPSLCLEYYLNLCTVVEIKKDGTHIFGVCLYDKVTNATAAQRAEAFLRTIGKWEDSK